ncbi:MAG: GTP-binding protein [Pegethrix bostrychoides GSE-TBD4-15B]|jgi:G3E family GTPase|uniref:GTP-binding protein n=1 Tax=Pegethrix bostrychoides GSE-TBD4-15B TaxID=2839662 RepID=A0A951PDA5_9CYAN|nr:GTP-binding protein [Pegethrix bostrychoides GSE-TBD4-15B]
MIKNLPFTVIGGYLGAGKTTLLNHLLTNTQGLRIAVLVNDFGSINIDADLIRSHEGDTINLSNGCMCCSIADNFAIIMGKLRERTADLDRIVIEASGVADPAKIAQYGQMYQLPLDGILVVTDAEQVSTQAQNKYVGDTVLRQFTQADLIILNKTDLVSAQKLTELRSWLAELASGTPVIETVLAQVPIEVLLGSHGTQVAAGSYHNHHFEDNHAHTFETWVLEDSRPVTRAGLEQFAKGLGEEIYRAKGFVYLEDDPAHCYLYQQVGSRWSLELGNTWGDKLPQTQLVMIGRRGATRSEVIAALLAGKVSVEVGG